MIIHQTEQGLNIMSVGDTKHIACLDGRAAEKVVETVVLSPSGRQTRLDVYKIPSDELNHAVYVFTANNFMQCNNTDKNVVLAELAAYIVDNCKI